MSMLDWEMDWNGGMDYGMDYGIKKKNKTFFIAMPGSTVQLFAY